MEATGSIPGKGKKIDELVSWKVCLFFQTKYTRKTYKVFLRMKSAITFDMKISDDF